MTEWISVKDRLPKKYQFILYSSGSILFCSFGKYCGKHDPMPSAPPWLPWERVKFWMEIPEPPRQHD